MATITLLLSTCSEPGPGLERWVTEMSGQMWLCPSWCLEACRGP